MLRNYSSFGDIRGVFKAYAEKKYVGH